MQYKGRYEQLCSSLRGLGATLHASYPEAYNAFTSLLGSSCQAALEPAAAAVAPLSVTDVTATILDTRSSANIDIFGPTANSSECSRQMDAVGAAQAQAKQVVAAAGARANERIAEAEAKAEQIIAKAEAQAKQIIAEAEATAHKLSTAA